MQSQFIGERRYDRLVLFFNGWGMDANPFDSLRPENADLLTVYDYRSLELDLQLLSGYRAIRVVAWSMGVWAAERFLSSHPTLPIVSRTAVNGTLFPVDAARGIHPDVFGKTLEGLNDASLEKFRLRMCGTAQAFRAFSAVRPARDAAQLAEELAAIGRESCSESRPNGKQAKWDTAVIGTADRIFLPGQQRAAWQDCASHIIEVPAAHYCKPLLDQLLTTGSLDGYTDNTNR